MQVFFASLSCFVTLWISWWRWVYFDVSGFSIIKTSSIIFTQCLLLQMNFFSAYYDYDSKNLRVCCDCQEQCVSSVTVWDCHKWLLENVCKNLLFYYWSVKLKQSFQLANAKIVVAWVNYMFPKYPNITTVWNCPNIGHDGLGHG